MRRAFVRTLVELAESDSRIVLLTADLGFMVLEEFNDRFPERFFNVGVAEANMVGVATGLATCGYIPFCYSIAPFATLRPYEHIRNGPILHNLKVRIIGVGEGYDYGHGGFTHHALEDLAVTRAQPGLSVIVPADSEQLESALRQTYDISGPLYLRTGKDERGPIPNLLGRFRLGKCEVIREGSDLLIVCVGAITQDVVTAVDNLARQQVTCTVAVVSSLRPAPVDDLAELLSAFSLVVTVEEHYIDGGLGSLVAEIAGDRGIGATIVRSGVRNGLPQVFGGASYLRQSCGLNVEGIVDTVVKAREGIAG